jgi:hypothetical protein
MSSAMSDLTKRLQKVIGPLTKKEERRARDAVLEHLRREHPAVGEPRVQVFAPELRIEKPPRRGAVPARLIRVLVADYANRRRLDFTIDPDGGVVTVQPYNGLPVAPANEELLRARAIARQDDRIARVTRTRGVFVSEFAPDTPAEEGARLIGLRYVRVAKGRRFELVARAVIDLSAESVVFVEQGQPNEKGR